MLSQLPDRRDMHKLATDATVDNLRALLKNFASEPGFEALDSNYSETTTSALVVKIRNHKTDAKTASQLDEVLAHLSGMDVWIDLRVRPNSTPDPKAVAGEVIRNFVIPRRRAMDFYYLDCPPESPFC